MANDSATEVPVEEGDERARMLFAQLVTGSFVLVAVLWLTLWWFGLFTAQGRPVNSERDRSPSDVATEMRRLMQAVHTRDARLEEQRLEEQRRQDQWRPQRPSETDLRIQKERCLSVRTRADSAAQRMKAACGGGALDDVSILSEALCELVAIYKECDGDGSPGIIAMTELCNALLGADALDALSELQTHADAVVASNSALLFQHIVPRIWSF